MIPINTPKIIWKKTVETRCNLFLRSDSNNFRVELFRNRKEKYF